MRPADGRTRCALDRSQRGTRRAGGPHRRQRRRNSVLRRRRRHRKRAHRGKLYLAINPDSMQTPDGSYAGAHRSHAGQSAAAAARTNTTSSRCSRSSTPSCRTASPISRRRQSRRPGQLRHRRHAGPGDQRVEGRGLACGRQDEYRRCGQRADGDVAEECLRHRADEHPVPLRPPAGLRI